MYQDEKTETTKRRADTAVKIRNAAFSLVLMLAITVLVYFFNIPNPNMILIAGLTVFTTLYGYSSGVVCGLEMIVYSMFFFSTDHSFFEYTTQNLEKLTVIIIGVVLNVAFIGRLKKRQQDAVLKLEETNRGLISTNSRLEEATRLDPLTTVKNRYALRQDYDNYFERSVHVMMIDLDGFKQINDKYGHDAGDYLLKQMGRVLKESFGTDCTYRYGGDEFLVICPEVSDENFTKRIEEIRSGIKKIRSDHKNADLRFSAGYVFGTVEKSSDLRSMITAADSMMYRAKNAGSCLCFGSGFDRATVSP